MKKIHLYFKDTDFNIIQIWSEHPDNEIEELNTYFIIENKSGSRYKAKNEYDEDIDLFEFIASTVGIKETDYKFGFVMQINDYLDNSRKPYFVPVIYTKENKPEWTLSRKFYDEIEFVGRDIWEPNHMFCSRIFKNNALKYAYKSYSDSFGTDADMYLDYCTLIEDEKTLRFLHALYEMRLSENPIRIF
ncbi:MAG: hypothetical protein MJ181_01830 [Treponema sp.]|nr:hypothetical protein [Treponema sp.]